MGKSPAKWIKAVLFGKKSSKSGLSKDICSEKRYATKAPAGDLAPVADPAPNPPIQNFGSENIELEKGTSTGVTCDSPVLSSVAQDIDSENTKGEISVDDAESKRLEQAATQAQAAFRGYLARRAFRALKGVIRLQALIRGHLVRRQAVVNLRCMQAIVRIQALARGRSARLSDPAYHFIRKYNSGELADAKQVDISVVYTYVRKEKLTTSTFVCKLLAAVPTAMPLSLQYDVHEPNSVQQWLERWSLSRFWEPLPQPKKVDVKPQKKQSNMQTTVDKEPVRSKRSVRKVLSAAASGDTNTTSSFSEPEKPKRNLRKVTNHQMEQVQDQPQNELEKVKRNLRKVSAAAAAATMQHSEKSGTETDKEQQQAPNPAQAQAKTSKSEASDVGELVVVDSFEKTIDKGQQAPKQEAQTRLKISKSEASDVGELVVVNSSEKTIDDKEQQASKQAQTQAKILKSEAPDVGEAVVVNSSEKTTDSTSEIDKLTMAEAPIPVAIEEPNGVLHDHPTVEQLHLEGEEIVNDELSMKEDQTSKESTRRRRRSVPSKEENSENISQNTPRVPSYMASTESAKAKLKAQGSPNVSEDKAENGVVRRHSLSSSINGKINSLSPRTQRPIQANGKSGNKNNRSLSTSKDEKVLHAGWRR